MAQNYEQPYFLTFNQAKENGWTIKKGSESTWIRWGGSYAVEIENDRGETVREFRNSAKWFNVFNVACVEDKNAEIKIAHESKPEPIGREHTTDRSCRNSSTVKRRRSPTVAIELSTVQNETISDKRNYPASRVWRDTTERRSTNSPTGRDTKHD
jgi:antirestriction protein ArdC